MSGSQPSAAARSFAVLLAELEDGRLLADLTTDAAEMATELEHLSQRKGGQAAKGHITLKLSFTATQGVIEVIPEVTLKTPKQMRQRSIFWRGRDGQLVRSDPNQPDLPLRDVNGAAGAMRTVS